VAGERTVFGVIAAGTAIIASMARTIHGARRELGAGGETGLDMESVLLKPGGFYSFTPLVAVPRLKAVSVLACGGLKSCPDTKLTRLEPIARTA
jgi:hypothetical protein